MKFLEIVIKPETAFGSEIKGDTLFGHIFWQIVYDNSFIEISIDDIIKSYINGNPFLIVSSAYLKVKKDGKIFWYFKAPTIPLEFYSDYSEDLEYEKFKKLKKAEWIKAPELKIELKIENLENSEKTKKTEKFSIRAKQIRNKIDRFYASSTSIFEVENIWFNEKIEFSIFLLFNESFIKLSAIEKIFERIGKTGFGRDVSCGLGKFKILEINELNLEEKKNIGYALSPFVPNENENFEIFFNSFIRFGKHGNQFAGSRNPFKNLIIMADEGAIIKGENIGPFIGRGLSKISKICPSAIHQGYSITLPVEGFRG